MQIYSRFPEETVTGSEMPAGGADKGSCARHVLAYAHGTFLRYPLCRTLLARVADLESLLSGNISGRIGRILQERDSGILDDRFSQ